MTAPDRQQRTAIVAVLSGAAAIALAPIFVREAGEAGVGMTVTAFWRVMLAAPVLGLWTAAHHQSVKNRAAKISAAENNSGASISENTTPKNSIWIIALAGFFFACDIAVWHQSIKYTKAANATLLANFAPIFVTLFGWALFRARVTRLFIAGLAAALAGAVVVLSGSLRLSGDFLLGDALGLLTAVFYASYILTISRLRLAGWPVGTIMFGAALTASAALAPMTLAMGESLWPGSLAAWAILAGLALVSHVCGQGLIAYALAHLPAAFSSVALLLQPVLVAVFAWLLIGEELGALHLTGGVIVIIGIALARLGSDLKNKG